MTKHEDTVRRARRLFRGMIFSTRFKNGPPSSRGKHYLPQKLFVSNVRRGNVYVSRLNSLLGSLVKNVIIILYYCRLFARNAIPFDLKRTVFVARTRKLDKLIIRRCTDKNIVRDTIMADDISAQTATSVVDGTSVIISANGRRR